MSYLIPTEGFFDDVWGGVKSIGQTVGKGVEFGVKNYAELQAIKAGKGAQPNTTQVGVPVQYPPGTRGPTHVPVVTAAAPSGMSKMMPYLLLGGGALVLFIMTKKK